MPDAGAKRHDGSLRIHVVAAALRVRGRLLFEGGAKALEVIHDARRVDQGDLRTAKRAG